MRGRGSGRAPNSSSSNPFTPRSLRGSASASPSQSPSSSSTVDGSGPRTTRWGERPSTFRFPSPAGSHPSYTPLSFGGLLLAAKFVVRLAGVEPATLGLEVLDAPAPQHITAH